MFRPILLAVAPALAAAPVAAFAQKSGPEPAGPARIAVAASPLFGEHLTDSEGRSLYLFEADNKSRTTCYTKCAEIWPPLLTADKPQAKDPAQQSKLGTIKRKDGKIQVTYGGWPLYRFSKDTGPGTTKGQDLEGFGAEWYLVSPKGEKIEEQRKPSGK